MTSGFFTSWATREARSWLAPIVPQLSPSLTGFPWLSNPGQVLPPACISCRAVATTVIWLSAWHLPSSTARCPVKGASSYFLPHCVLKVLVTQSCPTLCSPMDCRPPSCSVLGDSPGKKARVGCHAFLQGIFWTQELNPGLPHCRQILYCLSHQESLYHEVTLLKDLVERKLSAVPGIWWMFSKC